MTENKNLLVFIHIPKTAGTSFGKIIEKNVGESYLYHGLRRFLRESIPGNSVIIGHMPYGIHWFSRSPVTYFTLLRDPVEQCISYYFFSRCWKGQPDYHDAMRFDLVSFYKDHRHRNMQTRYLGGYLPSRISFYVPECILLRNAKKRLREKVDFGIVEKYEESVHQLCDKFGWNNRPIIHSRHAKGRPLTTDFSSDVIGCLRQNNKLDVQLYEYACDLFDRRQ